MAKVTQKKSLKHTSTNTKDTSQLSVKQRLFARYKAQGLSHGRSAELAGYKAGVNAAKTGSKLAKKEGIRQEVSRILAEQDTRTLVDRESHLMELAKLRDKAVETGQIGSAVTAEHYRGKVANLYKDRLEVSEDTKDSSSDIMDRIRSLLGKDTEGTDTKDDLIH